MPNWCENELTIKGKSEEVQKFKEAMRDGNNVLDANKIIPYPEELRLLDEANPLFGKHQELSEDVKRQLEQKGYDLTRDGFNQGGYEWCIQNWGTKWGFCDPAIADEFEHDGETELEYCFDTAWSPPEPLIHKLGEMFPNLEFTLTYFEGGMGFNGILIIRNGQVQEDRCAEYFGSRGG